MADRRSKRDPVGNPGGCVTLCTLHWRGYCRGVSTGARGRRRSHLVNAALDRRVVCGGRARRGPCDRADGLWAQHRALPRRSGRIRHVLDGALGARLVSSWRRPSRCAWSCSGAMSNVWSSLTSCSGTGLRSLHPRYSINGCWLAIRPKLRKGRRVFEGAISRSYYDEVALKGLQLAQVDAERGALDPERLTRSETRSANLPIIFRNRMTVRRQSPIHHRCGSDVRGRERGGKCYA